MLWLTRLAGAVIVLALVVIPMAPSQAQSGDAGATMNIAYIEDGNPLHRLDLVLPPDGEGPFPVVMLLPAEYDLKTDFRAMVPDFVAHGWAVVAVNYEQNVTGLEKDALCAMGWLYANAGSYALDLARVAIFGAGWAGTIAHTIAVADDYAPFVTAECPHTLPEPPLVVAVASYGAYPVTESLFEQSSTMVRGALFAGFSTRDYHDVAGDLLNVPALDWRSNADLPAEAHTIAQGLPVYWLDEGDPPVLLVVGTSDTRTVQAEQDKYAAYLNAVGVPVEIVIKPRAGHRTAAIAGLTGEIEAFFAAQFAAVSDAD